MLVRPCEHILEVHPSARVIHVGGVGEMSGKRKIKICVLCFQLVCNAQHEETSPQIKILHYSSFAVFVASFDIVVKYSLHKKINLPVY